MDSWNDGFENGYRQCGEDVIHRVSKKAIDEYKIDERYLGDFSISIRDLAEMIGVDLCRLRQGL